MWDLSRKSVHIQRRISESLFIGDVYAWRCTNWFLFRFFFFFARVNEKWKQKLLGGVANQKRSKAEVIRESSVGYGHFAAIRLMWHFLFVCFLLFRFWKMLWLVELYFLRQENIISRSKLNGRKVGSNISCKRVTWAEHIFSRINQWKTF